MKNSLHNRRLFLRWWTVLRVIGHLRVHSSLPASSHWAQGERCFGCPAFWPGVCDGPWLGTPALPLWGSASRTSCTHGASATANSWAGGSGSTSECAWHHHSPTHGKLVTQIQARPCILSTLGKCSNILLILHKTVKCYICVTNHKSNS